MPYNHNFKIINTRSQLLDVTDHLKKEKVIAFDMEADSMFHFREKVCLLQLATQSMSAIIDPLAIRDMSPLKPIFADPEIKKISHGADYDVRSLYRDFSITINNLFDTQLACRFLGIHSTGLDAILKSRLNVAVNKKYQKKDWSQRPLPEDMIKYAAEDVRYLIDLADIMEKEIKKKGRLCWVAEECQLLSNVRPSPSDETWLFLNFKGAGKLSPRKLVLLEALLAFRKSVAQKKDKPLFKIIGNNAINKLVQEKPLNMQHLKITQALSFSQMRMYGPDIIEVIKNAINVPENKLPVYPRNKISLMVTEDVSKRINKLKLWRTRKSDKLQIDPSLIFNKTIFKSIAEINPQITEDFSAISGIKNWQKKEFARDIISVLEQ